MNKGVYDGKGNYILINPKLSCYIYPSYKLRMNKGVYDGKAA